MVAIVLGGILVQVAGGYKGVLLYAVELFLFDHAYLGMHLHIVYAQYHLYTLFFQLLFPAHIGLFVKAGAELQHHGHFLTITYGIDERIDHL